MYKVAFLLALGVALAQGASFAQSSASISKGQALFTGSDASVGMKAIPRGIIDIRRCGGVGTPVQLRISDCAGALCELSPGKVYNCEFDFMPSSASVSLTLKVEICMSSGICMQIIMAELPGSSVQPGAIYTAKYSFVPNDVLAGQTVEFRASLLHSDNLLVEVCAASDVKILFPIG